MSESRVAGGESSIRAVETALSRTDLTALTEVLGELTTGQVVEILERLDRTQRAIVYRLLSKDRAMTVFEGLDPALQGSLVGALQDDDVAALFAELEPDDRVGLLDELPATVAGKLLQGLPPDQRDLTAEILGYPRGSIGRRMSPEYIVTHPDLTVAETLDKLEQRMEDAETIYTLPVTDRARVLVGVVSLRDLLKAPRDAVIADIAGRPDWAYATEDSEQAARRCADLKRLALPVVDSETRLVGIFTFDDALRILEDSDSEDQARISGTEPLRQPYLATPVFNIVRSRVVWLLVLAIGASLTVQVLEVFEATLGQMVALALFIPLLIGTGGNTGNQAATTVTRALALNDVTPRDLWKVFVRELCVGLSLGLLLGTVGFVLVTVLYEPSLGLVIGLTLLSICTMAASVGGVMPMLARAVRADPAVFSNPFITTFVDATGLLVYFMIAKVVLGI
ncbi:magnesium transporter [Rhodococcus sp. (in: high G+C Gram-positive bacteria)]|uniref:magnesium transporter n=1 Tax=Rhodococcus sp. TaxID=1831 RepID=UPI00388FC0D5